MSAATAQKEVTFDEALQMAIEMHRSNQLEGAVELYRRLLEAAPGHPDALHLMGMALHQMGRSNDGVSLIEQAIQAEPGYAGYRNNLGNIHMSRGDVAQALAAYEHAVRLDETNADLHNNLGALYKVQQQLDAARASYEPPPHQRPQQHGLAVCRAGRPHQCHRLLRQGAGAGAG
jgi:Flp pilus assembly protein TadD